MAHGKRGPRPVPKELALVPMPGSMPKTPPPSPLEADECEEEGEDERDRVERGLPSPVDVFEGHITPPIGGTVTPPLPEEEAQPSLEEFAGIKLANRGFLVCSFRVVERFGALGLCCFTVQQEGSHSPKERESAEWLPGPNPV